MAGKPLRILCVGKIKTAFWKAAAEHYGQRIRRWRPLDVTEVRDGDASLPVPRRNEQEGKRLLEALTPQDIPLILDERGASLTSPQFASLLQDLDRQAAGRPCFIIGGPFGLDDRIRAAGRRTLCLGPMTLPHELARVLLLEQLYRAECIARNIPYHHE